MSTKFVANASPPANCRMAIPKKGRLYQKVADMLKGAGLEYHREDRLDVALCKDLPLTLIFLPASDIASYVGEGNVDIGITGIDCIEESEACVDILLDLGVGKCKLSVQAPAAKNITNPEDLAGGRIVTSFPFLTKRFFDPIDQKKGVKTHVKFVSGSVEAACGLGLGDAVVDLVETGTTMRAAGLEIVADVLETQAVLIKNPQSSHKEMCDLIKRRVEGFITATRYVMLTYNISVDKLEKACAITPGKRSPTITGLDDPNYKSVSSLVLKSELNAKMDALHDVGATDILAINISNTRM